MKKIPHTQKTDASESIAGVTYQRHYFLNELINIKVGQSIGFETCDDVHVTLEDGSTTFIQVKHTTNAKSTLRRFDIDLWKTLSNWAKIISDRTDESRQLEFLEKSHFRLATNKKISKRNDFYKSLLLFQRGNISIHEFLDKLRKFYLITKNSNIKTYIKNIQKLNDSVLNKFFLNILIQEEKTDMAAVCKKSIQEKHVQPHEIDYIFQQLDSQIDQDIHNYTKNKEKFTVTFNDFQKNYGQFFREVRANDLIFQKMHCDIPADLLELTFMKQLLEINEIDINDDEDHIYIATNFFNLKHNLENFEQDGLVTRNQIEKMEEIAKHIWRREFREAYRSIKSNPNLRDDDIKEKACQIVYRLRHEKIMLASTELTLLLSESVFYELSDRPQIGWRPDWEKRYSKCR